MPIFAIGSLDDFVDDASIQEYLNKSGKTTSVALVLRERLHQVSYFFLEAKVKYVDSNWVIHGQNITILMRD